MPILGVCLGHQCIGAAHGGRITRAVRPLHGRGTEIEHVGIGLFRGLHTPLTVGCYHSLVVVATPELEGRMRVTARAVNGEIMALAHVDHPTWGVQFHPESVLSRDGHDIFANFFASAREWWAGAVA